MSERGSSAVITLDSKGASLTSSSIYVIPNSLVHVRLDSSALDCLSSSPPNQNPPTVTDYQVPLLKALTLEESRASLTVLLNKLLSLQSGLGIRAVLSVHISKILNSGGDKITSEPVEVSEDEQALLEKLSLPSVFCGVCAVLDYKSTALSTIIDAVAAVSWEVSGADVATFNLIDSRDGFTAKEEIAVAGDLKVLLNGLKLVGKVNTEEVLEILKINRKLRVVKLVHSSTRIELNLGVRVGMSGTTKALGANVMALVSAVKNVGESSLFLAKMSLSKVGGDELKSLFGKDCLSLDSLRSVYKLVLDAHLAEDYIKFVHEANVLLELVLKIVAWETVIAIVVLTNHFKVNVTNVNGHFFHYSVSLSYEDGRPVDGKGIGRREIDRVQETYNNELTGKDFAYNGEKSLSTVGPLPRNKLEFTVMLEEISSNRNNGNGSPDGCKSPSANDRKRVRRPYRSKTYKVEISFAAKIPMQSNANALRGQESENSQEALRVLDIILRQNATKHGCLLIRQSFFHNDPKNFAKVEGRVLSAPRLKVGNGEDFFLQNRRWNFNNKKLVEPTKIKRWAVVNFSARCDIRSLVRDLKKCGDMKGLKEDLLEEQLEGESEYKYSSHSDLEVLNKWKGLPDCK